MKNFYLSALMLSLSAAPVFAQETAVADDFSKPYECSVELTTATSTFYRYINDAWQTSTGFNAKIVGQTSPSVSVTVPSKANNITTSNNAFALYSGQVRSSVYNVTCDDPDYYVASFSFDASTTYTGTDIPTITIGSETEATTLEATAQTFEGSFTEDLTASFTIKGANQPVSIPALTVTLRRRSMPATSGWYLIKFISGHANTAGISNNYVVNADNEFFQNTSNQYALKFVSAYSETTPANKYIYITVGNKTATATTVQFKSANGHYINSNCTSNRNTANVNVASMTTSESDYTARVRIGGYWSIYTNNGAESPYVGQSSAHSANLYEIVSADPAAEFDVWTVSIINAPDATSVTYDDAIICNSPDNKGIAKVYNNGNYFISKGAELTAADFTLPEIAENPTPLFIVDNDNKTITLNYITRAELLEQTETSLRDNFGPWLNNSIFSEKAEEICSERLEALATAIGDDNEFSDEEIQAFGAIALTPSNDDILAIKAASVGKHVIFANPARTNTPYIYTDSDGAVKCIAASAQPVGLNGIWVIDNCDETTGKVSMFNYSNGKYLVGPDAAYACNVADEPAMISVDAQTIENKHVTVIYNSLSSRQYLHAANNGDVIGYSAGLASSWYAYSPELDDYSDHISAEITKDENAGLVMTLTHADGVNIHEGYHETIHAIKITAKQASSRSESGFTLSPASLQHDPDNNTVTIQLDPDNKMINGNSYEIELPLALVKIGDNKFSRPVVATVDLDDNGNLSTGIKEFDAVRNDVTVIFDLQGRRLSAPVKGINIINGRKVLVK